MTDLSWKKLIIVMAVGTLLALSAAVFGDSTESTAATKLVTIRAVNVPVIDAIDLLFQQAGYKYTIQPGVSGNITLDLKDMSFRDALKSLADRASLSYSVKDGRYILSPMPRTEVTFKSAPVATEQVPQPEPNPAPTVIVAPPDNGPVFYGSLGPEPYGPVQFFPGAGTIYAFPGAGSFFVSGGPPGGIYRTPRALDSPLFSSPDWMRFKAAVDWFQYRPKFY